MRIDRMWVVFNNDSPLAVCFSQEQADRHVAGLKEKHAVDFHWHEVPASKERLVKLRSTQIGLLLSIQEAEGAEIFRSGWPACEKLKALGLVEISGQRGPGGSFKRVTLTALGELVAEMEISK